MNDREPEPMMEPVGATIHGVFGEPDKKHLEAVLTAIPMEDNPGPTAGDDPQ